MDTNFQPVDLVDTLLVNKLINLPLQLNTKDSLYKDAPDKEAELNDLLQKLADHLFTMNTHRRSYKQQEKRIWKEFKKESQKSKVKDQDIVRSVPELQKDIEGFFNQVQPTLDSLAQLLNFLLGSTFSSWEKEIDVEKVTRSGFAVAKFIEEQSPENKKQFATELAKFVTTNGRWLGYLTTVTATRSEDGGLAAVSPLVFEQKHRTVIPQLFTHSDGFQEPVMNFMNRATQELILFVINVLVFAFQISAKDLYLIKTRDKAGHQHYQWVPMSAVDTALENKAKTA